MGWRFLIEERLGDLNERRAARDRKPLSWAEVARLIGVSRQALQNLASNRELKVTNTRHLEALCRFFACKPNELMALDPEIAQAPSDEELDRSLAMHDDANFKPPGYHIDQLYSEEASEAWKASHRSR